MEEVDARVISVRSLFRIRVVSVYISEELFCNKMFVRNTLVYLLIFINIYMVEPVLGNEV
jgi:hypothetical protein